MGNQVKLVIWDLDETFWRGTLSEGAVKPIDKNIEIVNQLVDRGIMCSIVSKNNESDALAVLDKWGVRDLFIFPRISWNSKGGVVKNLLLDCGLRAENTVFIDDNVSNLEEVKYYNPGIRVFLPEYLESNFIETEDYKGKSDTNHSRLKQYKTLENRSLVSKQFSSNEEFLRSSGIVITCHHDCHNYEDRIVELVERTNQLNFTKKRISKNEIHTLLMDDSYETCCISVKDNFGDYGITGFYALKDDVLEHFLFSCRTLGFGVEEYLYCKLGCPELKIVGEITSSLRPGLQKCTVDWISESNDSDIVSRQASVEVDDNILIIGGCDLEQTAAYLSSKMAIRKEFATVINHHDIRTSDTSQIVNSIVLPEEEKRLLCNELPFFDSSVTFNTDMFSGKYTCIIISVVDDYIRGIFKHKTKGYYIGFASYYSRDYSSLNIKQQDLAWLNENFDFVGSESPDIFKANLRFILSKLENVPKVIIVNGPDIDVSDWIGIERIEKSKEMNSIVDEVIREYDNVRLLDMRDIVNDRSMLVQNDNRHFDRQTYYRMAEEIVRLCTNNQAVDNYIGNKLISEIRFEIGKYAKAITNKIKDFF